MPSFREEHLGDSSGKMNLGKKNRGEKEGNRRPGSQMCPTKSAIGTNNFNYGRSTVWRARGGEDGSDPRSD